MEAYQRLEKEWADFNGVQPETMVACSSGTAALHLAFESLNLPRGGKVLVPNFAMISCARAVTMAGLEPVLIDCGEDLNLNWSEVDEAVDGLTSPTFSAILVVHTYGRNCRQVADALSRYGLPVIEDLAEAHGIHPHPTSAAACWSFYKNKVIAGEEGGAVYFGGRQQQVDITGHSYSVPPTRARMARYLRNQGFTDAHDFVHIPRGQNYRLANCLAEKVLSSLTAYYHNLAERRALEAAYDSCCPPEWKMPPRDVPWVYDLRVPGMFFETQDRVIASLQQSGVAARHAFKPVSSQLEYRKCRVFWTGQAMRASREVIYLPLTPGSLGTDQVSDAFEAIRRCLGA